MQAYCTYAGIKPQMVAYRMPDISWIKELVRQDFGISLMVKNAIQNEPGIVALDIQDPILVSFTISVAVREGYVLSPEEETLVDRLKELK